MALAEFENLLSQSKYKGAAFDRPQTRYVLLIKYALCNNSAKEGKKIAQHPHVSNIGLRLKNGVANRIYPMQTHTLYDYNTAIIWVSQEYGR